MSMPICTPRNIGEVRRKAQALQAFATDAANKGIADALNRVSNLAAKATTFGFDAAAFVEPAERELGQAWAQAKLALGAAFAQDDEAGALVVLSSLEPAITAYFDSVMVMADDPAIRANRLALLRGVAATMNRVADISKLV